MNPDELVRMVAAMRTDLVEKRTVLRYLTKEAMPEAEFALAERALSEAVEQLNHAIAWININGA